MIQKFDRKRFVKKHPLYTGKGIIPVKTLPYTSLNNHEIYLTKSGGFIDVSTIKNVVDFVNDNKDSIQQGISTAKSIKDTTNNIINAVKSKKDLEALKIAQSERKKKENKHEEYSMNAEQLKKLDKLGNGFSKF